MSEASMKIFEKKTVKYARKPQFHATYRPNLDESEDTVCQKSHTDTLKELLEVTLKITANISVQPVSFI